MICTAAGIVREVKQGRYQRRRRTANKQFYAKITKVVPCLNFPSSFLLLASARPYFPYLLSYSFTLLNASAKGLAYAISYAGFAAVVLFDVLCNLPLF
jgi:hypothetical protein